MCVCGGGGGCTGPVICLPCICYKEILYVIKGITCIILWLKLITKATEMKRNFNENKLSRCQEKGVYLNRPAQMDCDQFSQSDVASNFDRASTRIHVERFIG